MHGKSDLPGTTKRHQGFDKPAEVGFTQAPVPRSLVIVESPAKAKTIEKFLGKDYVVESSIGHIRDLARPRELTKDQKAKSQYIKKFAVDVEAGFRPIYVISVDRKSHITKLKKELKESDQLLLATDEDREGESIAWHLLEVLKPKVPVKRMVFHEITKKAILEAVENPRTVNQNLVDAQEARRILDRLYGFAMSGVVQRRSRGQSAGRVQSVATRIVVERERARIAFVRASYWSLSGLFEAPKGELNASLLTIDGKRVAEGRDFDAAGKLTRDVVPLNEASTTALVGDLDGAKYIIDSIEKKPFKRSPAAPFMTSTLQQEAGRKLRFGAARTMRSAQRLYENGYITYMRTDSTTLSQTALNAARNLIRELYSEADLPPKPRVYAKKVKNAQEAHEAIRPAGDRFKTPAEVAKELGPDDAKLYELIWKRTVASQMADAKGESMIVKIGAQTQSGKKVVFTVRGNTIVFPGFLKAYVEGTDDPEKELESRETHLPPLEEGQVLTNKTFTPKSHETQPPARFTEASLVKRLEELGVGRPSTYASIISVIQDRGYIFKKGSALVPSFKAFQVVRLLEEHFGHLVDYAFTARMEDDLDEIASGKASSKNYLQAFFFGGEAHDGLEELVEKKLEEIDLDEIKRIETFAIGTDEQERKIVVRMGQFGPYLQVVGEDQTVSVPPDLPPDELTLGKAVELLSAPSKDRELGVDDATGLKVYVRAGRYGDYVQLGEVEKGKDKPKTASLFKTMEAGTITLAEAQRLLSLPREVGTAEDGETVFAHNGRYGPYLVKGKDNRSLTDESQIFGITLPEAMVLFAQPKRGRRSAASAPLRELGQDGVSGQPIVLKEGRYGPYVTDGETNASLRTGDDPQSITTERAQELLQLRREKLAAGGGKRRKATKKKTTKKKSSKKAAKKSSKKAAKKATKKATKKAAKKKTSKKGPTATA